MSLEIIKIWDDLIEINNVTALKEFNNSSFLVEINNELFIIDGLNLELLDVSNNNSTLKIKGTILKVTKGNYKKPKDKSFIKRLFS